MTLTPPRLDPHRNHVAEVLSLSQDDRNSALGNALHLKKVCWKEHIKHDTIIILSTANAGNYMSTKYQLLLQFIKLDGHRNLHHRSHHAGDIAHLSLIRRIRISEFPHIRMLCYGLEKQKCWSCYSIGVFRRKQLSWLSWLIGNSEQIIIALIEFVGPKLNFSSLLFVDCRLQCGSRTSGNNTYCCEKGKAILKFTAILRPA